MATRHAVAQTVSYRALTAESPAQSRSNPYGICGEESGTGAGFSPRASVSPAPGTDCV